MSFFTGCNGPFAAKMAIARTLHTISRSAGVKIGVRRFNVINEVGAAALNATIDCNAFANTHTATSHYDKDSFVGLAWRPVGEKICAETYSTGKTNLPGSRRERDLLRSWSRMAGELYRHSNKPEKASRFDERLSTFHQPAKGVRSAPRVFNETRKRKAKDVWENDSDGEGEVGAGVASAMDFGDGAAPSLMLDMDDVDASLLDGVF